MSSFIHRLIWNSLTRDSVLRVLQVLPIRRGRVMCVCWGGEQYNCNPKEIVDQLRNYPEFEVWFAFKDPQKFRDLLPSEVHAVEIGSFKYFRLLATSQFIISNTRIGGGIWWPFKKRSKQIYIFTGHGGNGIKKIEFDADSLSREYLAIAANDTSRIDLFLSGSSFRSRVIRSAYRYKNEILEKGTPRNDSIIIAANTPSCSTIRYLLYAPTFRNSGRRDVYGFDIDRVIAALETKFGGEWYVRVSSHPNMRSYYHTIYDFTHPRMIDVGGEDLQPLLLTSDALITDYSSAEMDFSLTKRPVFQLCRDRQDYDRGFYLDPQTLPFPYAENDDQLIHNILNFDNDKYLADLEKFNTEVIGLRETGQAAQAVVDWMLAHR